MGSHVPRLQNIGSKDSIKFKGFMQMYGGHVKITALLKACEIFLVGGSSASAKFLNSLPFSTNHPQECTTGINQAQSL
jgi:hypothetical protein